MPMADLTYTYMTLIKIVEINWQHISRFQYHKLDIFGQDISLRQTILFYSIQGRLKSFTITEYPHIYMDQ